jgi:hypothetical protein
MPQTINVLIPRKGIARGESTVQVETQGFVGEACSLASAFLNQLGVVQSDVATAEMYDVERAQEHLRRDGGDGSDS